MSYNYAREIKKWRFWKQEEENLLRSLGADEDMIMQLRDYDYQMFLADRRIRYKQTVTMDKFFLKLPYFDKREINSVNDLLDDIENEILFNHLSKTDPETLNIILLKVLGYSAADIAKILNVKEAIIYNRIHRLKKKLKKFISSDRK